MMNGFKVTNITANELLLLDPATGIESFLTKLDDWTRLALARKT